VAAAGQELELQLSAHASKLVVLLVKLVAMRRQPLLSLLP
jgi:hypothetical protein